MPKSSKPSAVGAPSKRSLTPREARRTERRNVKKLMTASDVRVERVKKRLASGIFDNESAIIPLTISKMEKEGIIIFG